jgi:hypothetical protein
LEQLQRLRNGDLVRCPICEDRLGFLNLDTGDTHRVEITHADNTVCHVSREFNLGQAATLDPENVKVLKDFVRFLDPR